MDPRSPVAVTPELAAASAALCDVAKRLPAANRHMASWLGRFTSFAIGGVDAADRFRGLRDEFNIAKAGPELHKMKYRCSELGAIFDKKIRPFAPFSEIASGLQ